MPPPPGERASNPSPKNDHSNEIRRGVKRRLIPVPSSVNGTDEDVGAQQKPDEDGKDGERSRHLPEDAGPSLPHPRKSTSREKGKRVIRCRRRRTPLRDITAFVNAMDWRMNLRSTAGRQREAGLDPLEVPSISVDGPLQHEPSGPKDRPPNSACNVVSDGPPAIKSGERRNSTGDYGNVATGTTKDAPEETSRKPKRCKTLMSMR